MRLGHLIGKGRGLVRRSVSTVRLLSPARLYRTRAAARWRRDGETILADFMTGAEPRFKGAVLVDAMWDNPNYWIRYALFRAAVGSAGGREVGMVGFERIIRSDCHRKASVALARHRVAYFGTKPIGAAPGRYYRLGGDEGYVVGKAL